MMTLREAIVVALVPERHTRREQRRAEKFILGNYLRDYERDAYALATSDIPDIGATHGSPHWSILRDLLFRGVVCKAS